MSTSGLNQSNLKIDYREFQELKERHQDGDYDPYKAKKGTKRMVERISRQAKKRSMSDQNEKKTALGKRLQKEEDQRMQLEIDRLRVKHKSKRGTTEQAKRQSSRWEFKESLDKLLGRKKHKVKFAGSPEPRVLKDYRDQKAVPVFFRKAHTRKVSTQFEDAKKLFEACESETSFMSDFKPKFKDCERKFHKYYQDIDTKIQNTRSMIKTAQVRFRKFDNINRRK